MCIALLASAPAPIIKPHWSSVQRHRVLEERQRIGAVFLGGNTRGQGVLDMIGDQPYFLSHNNPQSQTLTISVYSMNPKPFPVVLTSFTGPACGVKVGSFRLRRCTPQGQGATRPHDGQFTCTPSS